MICTADTYIMFLTISAIAKLENHIKEFWEDFEAGKNRKFYTVHATFKYLGESKALSLAFLHNFTLRKNEVFH